MNLNSLNSLEKFNSSNKPSNLDMVYYIFWEKGISLTEFNELPIPYIMSIVSTYTYLKEEEEKAYKKANKRR